ncbi:MAG: hypothetical protein MMC33_009098, partial [Icmadophila ericetorum]|nr:hypothetical protein [Icmadophila ericetorum]
MKFTSSGREYVNGSDEIVSILPTPDTPSPFSLLPPQTPFKSNRIVVATSKLMEKLGKEVTINQNCGLLMLKRNSATDDLNTSKPSTARSIHKTQDTKVANGGSTVSHHPTSSGIAHAGPKLFKKGRFSCKRIPIKNQMAAAKAQALKTLGENAANSVTQESPIRGRSDFTKTVQNGVKQPT